MLHPGGVGTRKGCRGRMTSCRDGTICSSRLDFLSVPTTRVWTSLIDVIDPATLNSLRSQFARSTLDFSSLGHPRRGGTNPYERLKKPLMTPSVSLSHEHQDR